MHRPRASPARRAGLRGPHALIPFGAKYEWWCHIASGFWFVALRDTSRDVVIDTFPAEAVRRGLPVPGECCAMMHRLDAHAGEWLDRSVALRFTFEGREYQGYSGDTISAALAAAGVPYVARSFKYHRPRGILSFAITTATPCSRSTVCRMCAAT
jgi:2Fe-2S iron-sulfur cluster binding domain